MLAQPHMLRGPVASSGRVRPAPAAPYARAAVRCAAAPRGNASAGSSPAPTPQQGKAHHLGGGGSGTGGAPSAKVPAAAALPQASAALAASAGAPEAAAPAGMGGEAAGGAGAGAMAGGRRRKSIPPGSTRPNPRIVTAAAMAASLRASNAAAAAADEPPVAAASAAAANVVPASPAMSGAAPSGQAAGAGRASTFRALVLDSAYRPINVVSWFRAVTLELSDKVDVLDIHEGAFAVSTYRRHPLPAVVRVRDYMDGHDLAAGRVALTRRNLLLRDRHTCQYCGARRDLTVDHVVPVSRGGANSWTNLVTACQDCNQRKGHQLLAHLGWRLPVPPREPSAFELGLLLGVSLSDMEAPPPEWAPWLAPFRERLEKQRRRRAAREASAARTA